MLDFQILGINKVYFQIQHRNRNTCLSLDGKVHLLFPVIFILYFCIYMHTP